MPNLLLGQDFIIDIQYYGIEEGLSHRNVHFSIQDKRGLMWFGTDYGLNRFDGYHFKWITKEKHGIQSNLIKNALLDKDGFLWLLYGETRVFAPAHPIFEGIDIFNPLTDEAIPFEIFFQGQTQFQSTDFHSFTQKETGELVFLTKQMELVTYELDRTFNVVALEYEYEEVTNFNWSANGFYWMSILKEEQLFVVAIDEEGKEVHHLPLDLPFDKVLPYKVHDSPNEKWIATYKGEQSQFYEITPRGAFVDNLEDQLLKPFNLDFSKFGDFAGFLDAEAFYVFFSNYGFYLFNKKQKKLYQLANAQNKIGFATHMFLDQEGKIWASSQFGIYIVEPKLNHFQKIFYIPEGELNPVRGLTLDNNGALWVIRESEQNLWKFQLSADKKQVIDSTTVNSTNGELKIPFDRFFYELGLDPIENKILCFQQHGILKIDPISFKYERTPLPDSIFQTHRAWSYFFENSDEIWIGTEMGFIGSVINGTYQYTHLLGDPSRTFFVYQLIEDQNRFWIVSEMGLFLFDKSSHQVIERYWSEGEGKYLLTFDKLYHAQREENGTFWLGTSGGGLVHFDPNTGEYQQFTKADGFSNNTIYAVYPDEYDNLWLTSDYGIMRFNKTTHQVNTYLEDDGITHNEFNRISHHQSEDGTLFFGGLNGITSFHPKDFQSDSLTSNAPLVISKFEQFIGDENKLVNKTSKLLSENQITLAPNDPFFRIEFALLTFEDVDKIQFAYQVEGADQDWLYQKENFIRLSRLPYGQHMLRIKAQGSDGQWSNNELAIGVNVLKPFYLQTWFIILAILSVFGSLFAFYKWRTSLLKKQKAQLELEVIRRTKTIREQAEELKSLERLKSRFFANVSHELRTPLTLLSGPVKTMLKETRKHSKHWELLGFMQRNTNQLLKLINEILELSKLESGKLATQEEVIPFFPFLQTLSAQFQSYAASVKIDLFIRHNIPENLEILIDRDKTEKIIINFLSNAMKFTPPGGRVILNVEAQEDNILVSVQDTGQGIHPEDLPHIFDRFYQSKQVEGTPKGGSGIGLSLCRELAELLNGKVWAESDLGKGSIFYFEFPKKVVESSVVLSEAFSPTSSEEEIVSIKRKDFLVEKSIVVPVEKNDAQAKTTTILLVEDNPDLRGYIKILLPEYYIIPAENGKVALELLSASQPLGTPNHPQSNVHSTPELIICDLMMPVMDGFEFLEIVKSDDRWRHIPVIMLTAKVNIKARLKALRVGVDDYLTKPFMEEELKARIDNLLRNYHERMLLFSKMNANRETAKYRPVIAEADALWLEEVEMQLNKFLPENNLNMERVAEALFISYRHFTRRLKNLTGLTPSKYLKEMRLNRGKEYLLSGKYKTIKEVAYAVGFADARYFSDLCQKHFGCHPSEFSR